MSQLPHGLKSETKINQNGKYGGIGRLQTEYNQFIILPMLVRLAGYFAGTAAFRGYAMRLYYVESSLSLRA